MNYNSEGNYFDEQTGVVYHQHSVVVFGLFMILLIILTSFFVGKLKTNITKNELDKLKK